MATGKLSPNAYVNELIAHYATVAKTLRISFVLAPSPTNEDFLVSFLLYGFLGIL